MLAQLRQNTKIILWVVIVAFVGLIFVVWGMNLKRSGGVEAGIVGRVGDERITMEEYRAEVANQRAAYYQDKGKRSGATAEDEINQRAWDTIVQNRILWREVAKERLGTTNDEIFLELQSNPPAFIRSQPVFQTDSVFDHSKYLAALEDPRYDFRPLEAYLRATLPLQKLQEYMSATVRITDQEADMLLAMVDERATISYVRVSSSADVREVFPQPAEGEIASYYSAHPDEFKVPEKHKFRVVRFEKQPGEDDVRYATDRIQEALDLINEGEPFEEIAVEYSDDETTAPHGGDLGWVGRGRLPAAMDSAIAALQPGQVSGIIGIASALHVVKVEDRRTVEGAEEAKLRYITTRIEASPSTIEQLQSDAEEFASLAQQKGIDKAAAEQGVAPSDSPELPASQIAGFFRVDKAVANGILRLGKRQVSQVVEGGQAFFVIETVEITPERTPPVEEIRDRVAQAYLFSLKKDRARQIADAVAADAAHGRTLEDAAAARNLQVVRAEPFTRTSNVPGLGKDNLVIAQAFILEPGQTSKAIGNGNDFYVIRVEQRQPANAASLGQNVQQLRMAMLGTKQQALLTDWYNRLLAEAEVKDHRSAQSSGSGGANALSYIGY
jgi:peptidyl-prolyl cis-trans isomerase D